MLELFSYNLVNVLKRCLGRSVNCLSHFDDLDARYQNHANDKMAGPKQAALLGRSYVHCCVEDINMVCIVFQANV